MTAATRRAWPAVATLLSLAGLVIALYNYLAPITGVTGTPGALLVVVSTALLVLLALAWYFRPPGGRLAPVLILIDAIGTLLAAWLLHEYWLVAAMVVVALATGVGLATARGGIR